MTIGLRFRQYRLARNAAVASLGRSPSPFAGEGQSSVTVASLMLRLVIPLHEQLVAGVQGAAAGNHEDGRDGRPLAVRDDASIIPFAIATEDDEKLAFGSGSGDHLCGPPVAKPEHDGMANRCTGSAALSARARSPYFPGISEWLTTQS